jgi:dipeptide/tripeptide permease
MVGGIGLQGLAECFLSPRFLEFTSKQAPPGETGLYMGYSYLTSFFGNILGFGLSGYLLERWCPDPAAQAPAVQAAWKTAIEAGTPLPEAWAHAHLIWYVFAGVGAVAFVALLVFRAVTAALDRGEGSPPAPSFGPADAR